MSINNDANSASGSTPTAGVTPTSSAAKPPPVYRRRKAQVDPLIRRKPPTKPVPKAINRPNGVESIPSLQNHTIVHGLKPVSKDFQGPAEEYKIVTTKRALREGLRYHVMRLMPGIGASNKTEAFDPRNDDQFTPPVRLHRRDPRANPFGPGMLKEEEEKPEPPPVDDKEREKKEAIKKEKQAVREAFQAQTAPVAKNPVKKETHQKKTEQVHRAGDMSGTKANAHIRYEESLPWHLEDFDNKQTWAGTYEATLSEKHIMLLRDPSSNTFKMLPLEKWYKFAPKNKFQAISYEEAEARLAKKVKDPRWFMERKQEIAEKRKQAIIQQRHKTMMARRGERGERSTNDEDYDGPEITADVDDIDYDYEEAFADDEENPLYVGADEEDIKNAEDRIKREQREANVFDIKEEKDYDAEEEKERQKVEEGKKLAKRVQKALMKREKNYIYEDDSERNPYSSESDSEDSEAELIRQEEERKKEREEAEKNDAQNKLKPTGDGKPTSGASTKGTTTPSGLPKSSSSSSKSALKRPGSPNLSEASGNESARKKQKKRHLLDSTTASRTASRAASPGMPSSSRGGHASSSDGEMSDTTRRANGSRLSKPGSPNRSRAASPSAMTSGNAPASPLPTLTAEELRAAIPPQGLTLGDFMKRFQKRMRNRDELVELMKQNAQFVKENRTLYPVGAKLPDEVHEMRRIAREKRLAAQRASGNGTPAGGASGGLSPNPGSQTGGAGDGRKSPAS